jgi:hypothetical protein
MPVDEELDTQKKRKEIEKLSIDVENAKATVGLERFKAFAALLGPVMTAVTVLGAVYLGYLQIWSKSESDEDASWRQTILSMNPGKLDEAVSPHLGTLLKPFLESKRYRALAIGATIDELPRIRDVGTFEALFLAAFPVPNHKDLPTYLSLARKLTATAGDLFAASKAEAESKRANGLRDEWSLMIKIEGTLCGPIANVLRNTDHKVIVQDFSPSDRISAKIPLNNIYFEKCDFSGVDFSDADFTHSVFDWVVLDNADLRNVDDPSDQLWGGNIWWKAKEIDRKLLPTLIERFKPYSFPADISPTYRDDVEINQADWESNVKRLCGAAQLSCSDEQIRTKFPETKQR